MAKKEVAKREVVRQDWVESERGWGVRPDGYSLHLTFGDCQKYIDEYWATLPDAVPDEYSRPDGSPKAYYVALIVFRRLTRQKAKGIFGLRFSH